MINEFPIVSQTVSTSSFFFFTLSRNGRVIHLTFAQEKHRRACLFLQKSGTIVSSPPTELSRADLLTLLKRTPCLTEFSATTFIEQATSFQRRVWRLICEIGFGSTRTYGELAEMLGNKGLARAVGRACNANPIALFIPCHRVVGNAEIGGFSGGMEVKQKLLELEKIKPCRASPD